MLVVSTSSTESCITRVEGARSGSGSGSAAHGATLAHTELRGVIHGRWVSGVGNNSGSSTAGAAAKAANILGKVVVATNLVAALPITSAERNNTTAAHAATTTSTMTHVATMVAAVVRRRHHGRGSVAVAKVAVSTGATRASCRERASEASGSALEVGEAARGAGPVTRTGSVLARREWCEDILGAVEDAARRGRDLDSLFVQGSAIHAEALGSLVIVSNAVDSDTYIVGRTTRYQNRQGY